MMPAIVVMYAMQVEIHLHLDTISRRQAKISLYLAHEGLLEDDPIATV